MDKATMKSLKFSNSGEITQKDISFFGGKYSLFEKLKLKGVGSSKVLYVSGIKEFDDLMPDLETAYTLVNFELLKNGIIIYANKNAAIEAVGIRLNEIENIDLVAHRNSILIKDPNTGQLVEKIVYSGKITITSATDKLNFHLATKDFESLLDFFNKRPFQDVFRYTVSTDDPILDESHYYMPYLQYFIY